MPEIRFEQVEDHHRPLFENLWQLYFHDLSKFRGTRVGEDGKFKLGRLLMLFSNDDRIGYLFYKDLDLVGFCVIRGLDQETKIVSEFFILGPFQNQGLGKVVASNLFKMHPGKWEIPFQSANVPAMNFWRSVAETVAPSSWVEDTRLIPDKPDVPMDNWISFITHPCPTFEQHF